MRKLLLVPLAFLFILSCSKPQNEPVHGDLIENAKEFFDQNLKRSEIKNAKVSQIPNAEPIWEQATIRSMSRATVVQVPLSSDSAGTAGVTYGNHILPLRIKDYLFIYKDEDSSYRSLVMRCIPHGNGKVFSGLILLRDWDGSNPRINAFDGGTVSTTNARKTSTDGFNNAIRSCVTVNYWYSVNEGPWQFNFSNTFCTGDAGPEGPGDNAPGDWQELPPPDGGGGGSGSGDTPGNMPPPPVILTDVVDYLTSRCFKATLQYMGFNNLTSSLARTLSTLYQTSDQINARFYEEEFKDPMDDGDNSPQSEPTGSMININITLNTVLANGSQEYIAATMLHEMVHGYFYVKYHISNNNPWDHGQMAGDAFFNSMVQTLQEMYPALSMTDATALTWIGLQKTQQYLDLPISQRLNIESIAAKYRSGASGTKCN